MENGQFLPGVPGGVVTVMRSREKGGRSKFCRQGKPHASKTK